MVCSSSSETDDPADFTFICDRDPRPAAARGPGSRHRRGESSRGVLRRAAGRLRRRGPDSTTSQPRTGLSRRYALPSAAGRRRPGPAPDPGELDGDPAFGPGFATPDHLVHIAGKGTCCPATEPEETGLDGPWPPVNPDNTAGAGVSVVVIDTGWYPPAATHVDWLAGVEGVPEPDPILDPPGGQLRAYAGHGTFVAGVVRSMAPACDRTRAELRRGSQVPRGRCPRVRAGGAARCRTPA